MYKGVILHGRDFANNIGKDLLGQFENNKPDVFIVDIFTNGGLQAIKLIPQFSKLEVPITLFAPCYFVKGKEVTKSILEMAQLFHSESVMLNVILDVQDKELVLDFTQELSENTPDDFGFIVCGQINYFNDGASAWTLYAELLRRKFSLELCMLCNDSKQSLKALKAQNKFLNEYRDYVSISPIMLSRNYDEIFSFQLPVYFWNFQDFLSMPKEKNDQMIGLFYKAVIGPLSLRDNYEKSANIIAKIQKEETVQISDTIKDKYGVIWGQTVEGNYVILSENNNVYFERL